jgi:heme exporter protein C
MEYVRKVDLNIWLKILGVVLLIYVHIGGLLFDVPRLNILNETIRALYFHVPMWFGMTLLFLTSTIYSIKYLRSNSALHDRYAVELANVATIFGILGLLTGMLWAKYTWGQAWHGDPKQNAALISLLIYLAYFVLRWSIENDEQKARLSAVYNIIAFVSVIVLLYVVPRFTSSMHPGSGGNPGFNMYDLDSRMRGVFYPAVIGWFIIGYWIAVQRIRTKLIQEKILERND